MYNDIEKTYNLYYIGSPDGHKDHVTHYMICIYAALDFLEYQRNMKLCILTWKSMKTWFTATKLWFSWLLIATNEVFLGYLREKLAHALVQVHRCTNIKLFF